MDKRTIYKRITLKEIAKEELNLSISTVSAILNNKPNCFASKKTKEKVIRFVNELGYRPNFIARSLRKQKTNTIGFIAPVLNIGLTLNDIEFLTSLAWEKRYNLIIGYSKGEPEREEKILEEFYNRQVDGIILIPTGIKSENNFLKKLIEINFPIVIITKIPKIDAFFVSTDYRKGGYIATEFLIKNGHKKIGFLSGDLKYYTLRERYYGYKRALKKYGFKEEFIFQIKDEKSFEEIEEVSHKILDNGLDAVFVGNDYIAIQLINLAIKKGIKIPDRISVIGFDNSEITKFSQIPLTTIKQPVEKITKYSFNLLLKLINREKITEKKVKYFKTELIIRESVKRG